MYEDGCLLFHNDETAASLLPVWPDGSVFNGTSVIFHQPAKADQRIVIGEEFVMEGHAVPWRIVSPMTTRRFVTNALYRPSSSAGSGPRTER